MVLACPNRAEEVEIFSDESTARCPKCKMPFYKKAVPTCAKWCKASAECMGLRANADNTPGARASNPRTEVPLATQREVDPIPVVPDDCDVDRFLVFLFLSKAKAVGLV
jgi:hypothetical protein